LTLESEATTPGYTIYSNKLCKLSYDVLIRAYRHNGPGKSHTPSVQQAKALLKELDEWDNTLPAYFRSDGSLPSGQKKGVLLLQAYYMYTRCIVTRDYVVRKVEKRLSCFETKQYPQISEEASEALALAEDCLDSAYRSLQYISSAFELELLDDVMHMHIMYVFHATLVICADFLARSKDEPDSRIDSDRKATVCRILRLSKKRYLAPACESDQFSRECCTSQGTL
jgi:hypothetical protein